MVGLPDLDAGKGTCNEAALKTIIRSLLIVLPLMLAPVAGAAQRLPADIPARKPGLWEMATTGTVGPNQLKALKRYCLDAGADRALHDLHLLQMQLEVIYSDVSCRMPTFTLGGSVLSGEMACRTNTPDDDEAAGKDFRWEMRFVSDSEVVLEEHSVPRDVLLLLENRLAERQRRIGDCPVDMKPGDSLDLGFTYNSEDWPNKANRGNIHESLMVVARLLNEGIEINQRLGPM